ncbi:SnoK-like protein [Myxococcus hansupus]|uniref:SnoK-like protein n=1 Tax=Pseudomyxococcus hansupus TaxID=1297742 RepID=A0A0H4WRB5_9BACT|nr:phytanoyl-CoA dioxygenase family protein [Myxococcus hansupus]AKQ66021.1 SnoK-like protein [Myxococcus hansupus]
MDLQDDEVARYQREGFLKVPQVLTPAEVAECLEEGTAMLRRHDTLRWPSETGMVMDWVASPQLESGAFRRLALHPVITAIAERLAGRPLRMFKSELLRKAQVGSTVTPLHADEGGLPINGVPVTLTAWVALVDVPEPRGCMTFWPGTHQLALPDDGEALETHPEVAFRPRVTVPLRAGDCTFHHARTLHAAHANRTGETRISLATVYMDVEATFDPERLLYSEGLTDALSLHLKALGAGQPLSSEYFPRLR